MQLNSLIAKTVKTISQTGRAQQMQRKQVISIDSKNFQFPAKTTHTT